ncbi:MAG: DUF4442 domain-containing protein [Chitinophagales bacterium]|nr:DUF4442 domain-containing protein [Bacteroidota bacterium]MCB9044103.1 DUF4442 domain-containing protein [Chitinophagales bacterium]
MSLLAVNPQAKKVMKLLTNSWKFKLYLLAKLPMAFLAGLRVTHIDAQTCSVSVPYKWLNTNPFQSTYFAVLTMAAELSTGTLALCGTYQNKPSVAMLVTNLTAEFSKKAKERVVFTCSQGDEIAATIAQTLQTGAWESICVETVGVNAQQEEVARMQFEWSFRAKKNL